MDILRHLTVQATHRVILCVKIMKRKGEGSSQHNLQKSIIICLYLNTMHRSSSYLQFIQVRLLVIRRLLVTRVDALFQRLRSPLHHLGRRASCVGGSAAARFDHNILFGLFDREFSTLCVARSRTHICDFSTLKKVTHPLSAQADFCCLNRLSLSFSLGTAAKAVE